MELNQVFEKRKSVRNYKAGVTIPMEDLKEMIAAAQKAASWKNSQTARYYVASSEEMVEKVRACLPAFNAKSTANASVYVVTTFVMNDAGFTTENEPVNELGNEWGAYDLGLSNANMLMKAAELGYDSLIMGIRDADGLRAAFNVPADQQIAAVIGLGIGEGEPRNPARKPMDEIAVFM